MVKEKLDQQKRKGKEKGGKGRRILAWAELAPCENYTIVKKKKQKPLR